MQDIGHLTKGYEPRIWSAIELLQEFRLSPRSKILDLGCGTGRMYERLKVICPELDYVGIDIEHSPEVRERNRSELNFVTYDGVSIGYDDGAFDVVFSNQVFEHVRYQEDLLNEVKRVLNSSGLFIGSLSGLEPYHSYSMFNLTSYGWVRLLNESGFKVLTIRPGVDFTALIIRQFVSKTGFLPTSVTGNIYDEILRLDVSDIEKNRLMLQFSGHIVFAATPDH